MSETEILTKILEVGGTPAAVLISIVYVVRWLGAKIDAFTTEQTRTNQQIAVILDRTARAPAGGAPYGGTD